MAKKSFRKNTQQSPGGLGSIIQNTTQAPPRKKPQPPVSEPRSIITEKKTRKKPDRPASEEGCKIGDTRKTFILKKDLVEKMMDIAYWEPGKMKDHVNAAFEAYVEKRWSKKRPEGV